MMNYMTSKTRIPPYMAFPRFLLALNLSETARLVYTVLLDRASYEPPIHDFEIINAEGEDLTWDILESEEPVTLVVMYDLKKADKKQLAKVEALAANFSPFASSPDTLSFQVESEGGLYILTGSGTDEMIT